MMKSVPTKTTYLEMRSPPEQVVAPPADGVEVILMERPELEFYRTLYDSVGRDWHWVERKQLGDDELSGIIHHDLVEFYVLYVGGEPAGFCEVDCRVENQVQLMYFGLVPEFIGQGLGKYFLNSIVHKGWAKEPARVWLHTCNLDHEAALPNYLKGGFVVFDEKTIDHDVV